MHHTMRLFGSLFLLAALGCGGPNTGSVSGKITFEGRPLPNGQIQFHGEGGKSAAGAIAEGAYTVPNAPVGANKVTVRTFASGPKIIAPGDPSPPPKSFTPAPFLRIPEKYDDPAKSGLTLTVTGGSQTFDIDLKK